MPLPLLARSARIASGLVLLVFVTGHLITVALGLVSLPAISVGFGIFMRPWQSLPGSALLLAAGLVHTLLGYQSILARRSLAMRRDDRMQILFGLLIPILLAGHVVTVGAGLETTFPFMLALYWIYAPLYAIQQLTALVVVWIHAAIGFVGWAQLKPWWPRVSAGLVPALFAVPILSLLGFVEGGKLVLARAASDPAFRAAMDKTFAQLAALKPGLDGVISTVMTVAALAGAAAWAFVALRSLTGRARAVHVSYHGGLAGEGRPGLTLLEISRLSNVPHASLCSGRGRCGTCRVRVAGDGKALSPPDEVERRTLRGADEGGRVRLACRARVFGDVTVERLLPAHVDASAARRVEDWLEPAPATPAPAASAQAAPALAALAVPAAGETAA